MTHTMRLFSDVEGTQEWHCPDCKRIVLIEWEPQFTRTVIVPGNETVSHRGGTGGLLVHGLTVTRKPHDES